MKGTLLLLLTGLTGLPGHTQIDYKTRLLHQTTYMQVVRDAHVINNATKLDTAKPTVTLKVAKLYRESNILPTKGAVEILYKLNPTLDASRPIGEDTRILMPHYPPITQTQLVRSNQLYATLKIPSSGANEKFTSLSAAYSEMILAFEKGMKAYFGGFRDTTEFLRSSILPAIQAQIAATSQAQVNYFNADLTLINRLLQNINTKKTYITQVDNSIEQLIEDLMHITSLGLSGIPSTATKKGTKGGAGSVQPVKKDSQPQKKKTSSQNDYRRWLTVDLPWLDDPDWSTPVNTDVYVYRNGPNADEPVMDAYELHWAPNGIFYSLDQPGCDTLSYFSASKDYIASTLPLVLTKGNYCFLLRNLKTGKLSVHDGNDLTVLSGTVDDKLRIKISLFEN